MNLKKLVSLACASVFMLACSLEAHSSSDHHHHNHKPSNSVVYARASTLVNQLATDVNAQIASIENLNAANKVRLKNNRLILEEAGRYFVTASVQAGVITSLAPVAYVDIWFNKNGIPLPETRTRISVPNNQAIVQLSSQAVLEFNKRDYLTIGFSTSNIQIGLVGSSNPIIPSLTVSLFRI